jgi:hypothetical protein
VIERDMPDDYVPRSVGVQSEREVKEGRRVKKQSRPREESQLSRTNDYKVKDSGERMTFDSGMTRDTAPGKIDYWRVFVGPMFERLAVHVTKGAVKYPDVAPGVPNWTLAAGDAESERFRQAAARHFYQWMRGDTDEDHAAAVIFNINGYEYVEEKQEAAFIAELEAEKVTDRNPAREIPRQEAREPVRMHGRSVMLPTPMETLRRIKAIEQEEC